MKQALNVNTKNTNSTVFTEQNKKVGLESE